MKNIVNLIIKRILLITVPVLFAADVYAISKCQDANGKWHYGDFAVEECKNSKVTKLNKHGTKVGEQAAPKTAEQLEQEAAEEAILQVERDRKLSEEAEKRRILSIYESEADIDRQRDNQLVSVQGNIDVHNAYLKNMQTRVARYKKKIAEAVIPAVKQEVQKNIAEAEDNIAVSEKGLAKLEEQKLVIIRKFSKEKELYLKLTKNRAK